MLTTAAAGSVAMLAALVARLDADEQWPLDHAVRRTVRSHNAPRTRAMLRVAGYAGTVGVYGPATALAMAYVAQRRSVRRATPIALAVLGGAGLGLVLKYLVRRPRPMSDSGPPNTHPSFPSGHATRATALASILAYVAVRERIAPRVLCVPMATSVALATGISRAYADAHWTTDVIGGWAAGLTAMSGAALVYEHARAREHQ